MTRGDCDLEQKANSVLAGMSAVIKEFDDMFTDQSSRRDTLAYKLIALF